MVYIQKDALHLFCCRYGYEQMENKQIMITQFGGPEVLTIQSSPVPSPQKGKQKVAFAILTRSMQNACRTWVAQKKRISLGSGV